MTYPVTYDVDRPETYDRLTVAFRIILAIPQLVLVSILTSVAEILFLIAWFAILFTGRYPASFRDFAMMIFRWVMNVNAYSTLQTAPYPPFSGNAPYPLRVTVTPATSYKRLTVLFRIFMVIPHAIVLYILSIAQSIVTVIAWFAILFTGAYPEGMYSFSVGVSRWSARVSAYAWLLVDEYPPFSMAADPDAPQVRAGLA